MVHSAPQLASCKCPVQFKEMFQHLLEGLRGMINSFSTDSQCPSQVLPECQKATVWVTWLVTKFESSGLCKLKTWKTASISYVTGKQQLSKDFSIHILWVKATETLFYSSQNNLKRKITLYTPTIKGKNYNIMRYNFSQISKFDGETTHW
jgi:hypothetical protein